MSRVGYVLPALLLLAFALPAAAQQPFADVPVDHWAYGAVGELAEAGLVIGYPDGTFSGKQSLTRYEFAQAIARAMDRLEEMGGVPGPPGPPGPAGPPGAPGAGAGLTPEQQAVLDRLAKEFGPELKALRADLDALTKRVEDLEVEEAPQYPIVTVGGDLNWRVGLYGTSLGVGEDEDTTGFPWGYIPVTGTGMGIPITDTMKDSYKAGDFMTMQTRLSVDAQVNEKVDVNVTLLTGPEYNIADAWDLTDSDVGDPYPSPAFWDGHFIDPVAVDEATLTYRGQFITPMTAIVGKQYFSRAQGLLVDNDRDAVKAAMLCWGAGDFSWGAAFGMLDREHFAGGTVEDPPYPGELTSGQDNVNVLMLDWAPSDTWGLDLTYLDSGACEESGLSLGVEGEVIGLDFYGEYSQLLDWQSGEDYSVWTGTQILDLDESDTAWMGGLRWSSPAVCITGEYGEVDPGYALSFAMYGGMDNFGLPLSLLHPNAEVDPHDINWIDRPLFLDPTNIARGWHVGVMLPNLLGEGTPLSISYADGDSYCPDYLGWLTYGGPTSGSPRPDPWRDADAVWSVKVERQLSEGVSANLVYGQRETENVMAAGDPCADDVKVVRAEVNVAF